MTYKNKKAIYIIIIIIIIYIFGSIAYMGFFNRLPKHQAIFATYFFTEVTEIESITLDTGGPIYWEVLGKNKKDEDIILWISNKIEDKAFLSDGITAEQAINLLGKTKKNIKN